MQSEQGLSAAVYTQTTDVEGEINGLLTYDRELKVDVEKIKGANRGDVPAMKTVVVLPTAREQAQEWKYTFEKPADDWSKPGFDDSGWKTGQSGFGTEGTPGTTVRTEWKTSDIWLRRTIKLPADVDPKHLLLIYHNDEGCEIYMNGVLAGRARSYASDYRERGVRNDAQKAIKAGEDVVIAVHCNQTTGGQYIDVGLSKVVQK